MIYKKGDAAQDVRMIKDRLHALGYLKVKPTHERFGPDTEQAVKTFQNDKKLKADGIVGPLTWAALFNAPLPEPAEDERLMDEFIAYLEEQADNRSIYVWGAQGQGDPTVSEAWIRSRESGAGGYKDGESYAAAAVNYWKKQVAAGYKARLKAYDCSGLGVYWLLQKGLIKGDMTANGMRRLCAKITRKELRRGDWVFRDGHIGYIVDGKLNVIEARGRRAGVCKTLLTKIEGEFNYYGRPKFWG